MHTFNFVTLPFALQLVAASVAPGSTLSLFARQLPGFIPADGVDAATTQCLAACAQQVSAAHQTEFQKCAAQTTIEAQQSCLCASDFLNENKKCIPKCFKDEVANEAADAMDAACSQMASGNGGVTPISGSGDNNASGTADTNRDSKGGSSRGAADNLRAHVGAVSSLVVVALLAALWDCDYPWT